MKERFVVGAHPRLEVRVASGRVDVEVGDPGVISLEVEGSGVSDVDVTQLGEAVVVGRSDSGMAVAGRVRVTAQVPAGTRLDVVTASASLWARGSLGPVTVRTASGSVAVETVEALTVKTASGDVRADRVTGDVEAASASGDVLVGRVDGRIQVSSMSGDLRAEEVAGELSANTASGDLRIDVARGDEISVKSVSGDVHLGIPAGTRVEADLTSLSGRIRVPESEGEQRPAPSRHLRLTARTVSGDIAISRV